MRNLIVSPTEFVFQVIAPYIKQSDTVIDATAGNGYDTRQLAELVPQGHVYSFDIQEAALQAARKQLGARTERVTLIHDGHENMMTYIKEKPSAVLFNLGYLPGHKKDITTKRETTMKAIQSALSLLKTGGILAITIYRGHDEGEKEYHEILQFVTNLNAKQYHALVCKMENQPETAPVCVFITKKKSKQVEK